jgi:hypothetical protein
MKLENRVSKYVIWMPLYCCILYVDVILLLIRYGPLDWNDIF